MQLVHHIKMCMNINMYIWIELYTYLKILISRFIVLYHQERKGYLYNPMQSKCLEGSIV